MRSNLINKHYCISKDIVDELKKRSKGRFSTEVQALEHFLREGFEYEESKVEKSKILFTMNQCLSESRFIKKQLEQIFANFGWKEIQDPKQCIGYQKFLEQFKKGDKFND